MECHACGFDNPAGMRFCGACGTALGARCPSCGTENPSGFKFCGKCGTALTEGTAAPPVAEPVPVAAPLAPPVDEPAAATPEAERRQLTIMFTDLVGSTALSEQLDPEDLRALLHDYQAISARVVRRFDGHVAKFLGDGLLVFFGYPQAHEDDAQRAVRAGLGVLEAIGRLNTSRQGPSLNVRIAIHTGEVVIGEMDRAEGLDELSIVGQAPNITARLQELAQPNTVVISAETCHLTAGYFEVSDLGEHALKGLSQPMRVYRVLHESAARSRLEAAVPAGLTPLVGREQESALLLDRWRQVVEEGMGQAVLMSGEAGIGKSRLVQVVKEQIARQADAWLTEYRCSAYHQNSAFFPVIDHLEQVVLRFHADSSIEQKLEKLEGFLAQYGQPLAEAVPLFASLLSIPLEDRYLPLGFPPERQKQKTIQALLEILLQRAAEQPLLLVVDDLHWADPSTLELLDQVIAQAPSARLLALFTARPQFTMPWPTRSHVSHVAVTRLTRRQVEQLIGGVTGGLTLPGEVLEQIVGKTDGVPLFVEELTRMVLESDLLRAEEGRYVLTRPLPPLAIPTTLRDSLTARLDRLSPVKSVAQLGATLGREFSFELLQAVSRKEAGALAEVLEQLVDAEMLYPRGVPPRAVYAFKHALIQETAYESLLRTTRQQYHQRIAEVLEAQFPQTAEAQPELIAHHFTEAGLARPAIGYWLRAAQRALQGSANLEAIAHLNHGLSLLESLPDPAERATQELALQISLGTALTAIRGYTAPEVEQAYSRARELAQQMGDAVQLFPVLMGLWGFYFVRAEHATARELAEQLVRIADQAPEADLHPHTGYVMGFTLFCIGEYAAAVPHLELGIARYDPARHRAYQVQDSGVGCRTTLSWVLRSLGHADQGQQRLQEALELAERLEHPFSIAFAHGVAAFTAQDHGQAELAQEHAEKALAVATEYGFPYWIASAGVVHGWALMAQGKGDEGTIATMRAFFNGLQGVGTEGFMPYYRGMLAEACARAGKPQEGLSLLDEALEVIARTGERWVEAELHRLRGKLLLELDEPDQTAAEQAFRRSLEVAREQQIRGVELRTAVTWGRRLQRQGRGVEAQRMLSELYSGFSEGFDTPVLQAARTLLEELSAHVPADLPTA